LSSSTTDRVWSVSEHLDNILRQVRPLDPIELQLLDAQGCVLVEDVTVPVALPSFDNSSMDGYAIRTIDTEGATAEHPAVLTVIGDVAAGADELPAVGPGEAAAIMTGAQLPPGADAVVPVEWTDGGTGGSAPATAMTRHTSGEVRIRVFRREGGAVLEVADRGQGIPEADRETVFDRFVRLERSRTTPGNGLGLSLVRAIVRRHSGTVELIDNRPGLRVRIKLPGCSA